MIFIVGVGRSGTSLLQSMFAAHPQVTCLPETSFFRRYVVSGKLESQYSSGDTSSLINSLSNDDFFYRLNLDAKSQIMQSLDSNVSLDLEIYKKIVLTSQSKNTYWFVDKDPRLIEYLPVIAAAFPSAKIINIIRDPRDVLLSKKKAAWSKKGHIWKHVFANRVQLSFSEVWGSTLFGANYIEIIYEDLISSPREQLEGVCESINLPFDDCMLSFGEAAKKLVTEKELSWKKETFGPLLSDNKDKWRGGLTQREICLTELSCGDAFLTGNYIKGGNIKKLSWQDKCWLLTGLSVIFLMDVPYRIFRNFTVNRARKRIV